MTTLLADPQVADIPVIDNGEAMVDLVAHGIACSGRAAGDPGRFVRAGLADRLVAADAALPVGVRLNVSEGFRTAQSQLRIFTLHTERLRVAFPDLPADQIRRQASRYVSPLEIAPHVAGAAVDLGLIGADGRKLRMGPAADDAPKQIRSARAFGSGTITAEARANRTLLADVLTAAGLVNYPSEWWHWSHGDRYWAFATGAAAADYGPISDAWIP